MKSWREEYEEIFESEYFATCCDLDECECFARFQKNVRAKMKAVFIAKDIVSQRILEDTCEDAKRRWYEMNNKWE